MCVEHFKVFTGFRQRIEDTKNKVQPYGIGRTGDCRNISIAQRRRYGYNCERPGNTERKSENLC